jgi:hypothetical protein
MTQRTIDTIVTIDTTVHNRYDAGMRAMQPGWPKAKNALK